jgi:hypothetical protein
MSRIQIRIRIFTQFGRQHLPILFIDNLQLQNHVKTKVLVYNKSRQRLLIKNISHSSIFILMINHIINKTINKYNEDVECIAAVGVMRVVTLAANGCRAAAAMSVYPFGSSGGGKKGRGGEAWPRGGGCAIEAKEEGWEAGLSRGAAGGGREKEGVASEELRTRERGGREREKIKVWWFRYLPVTGSCKHRGALGLVI